MHEVAWHGDVNYVHSKDAQKQLARTSLRREEHQRTWRILEQGVNINNKHMTASLGFQPGICCWEAVGLTLTVSANPYMYVSTT